MKILFRIIIFVFLTIITQIGGIIYLISILITPRKTEKKRIKRLGLFIGTYLLATFLIVPTIAPFFGREKIKNTEFLQPYSSFYTLSNRNYVRPEMNRTIEKIAKEFAQNHDGIKMLYLDANFPFIDKFPLLPHLSHNDGKKIDISLIYQNTNGQLTNKKPSISGYGAIPLNQKKLKEQN